MGCYNEAVNFHTVKTGWNVQQFPSPPLEGCLTSIDCSESDLQLCLSNQMRKWSEKIHSELPSCDKVVNNLALSLFSIFVPSSFVQWFSGVCTFVHIWSPQSLPGFIWHEFPLVKSLTLSDHCYFQIQLLKGEPPPKNVVLVFFFNKMTHK